MISKNGNCVLIKYSSQNSAERQHWATFPWLRRLHHILQYVRRCARCPDHPKKFTVSFTNFGIHNKCCRLPLFVVVEELLSAMPTWYRVTNLMWKPSDSNIFSQMGRRSGLIIAHDRDNADSPGSSVLPAYPGSIVMKKPHVGIKLDRDTVKLIKAPPSASLRETPEYMCHSLIVHLICAVEHITR